MRSSGTCRSRCTRPRPGTRSRCAAAGELQLAVLIEQMRREGFELKVSRPEVILHGPRRESCRSRTSGSRSTFRPTSSARSSRRMAGRKARLEQMSTDADGRVRMEFVLPVRGLIGYRGQLLTETRGNRAPAPDRRGLRPVGGRRDPSDLRRAGERPCRHLERVWAVQAPGAHRAAHRPGVDVYEGMIVGENSRSGDIDVNATKEKKLTNMRTHAHDEALRLTPPRPLTLEIGDRVRRRRRAGRGDPARDPPAKTPALAARPSARGRARLRRLARWGRVARTDSPSARRARLLPVAHLCALAPRPGHPQQDDRPHPVRAPGLGEAHHVRPLDVIHAVEVADDLAPELVAARQAVGNPQPR